MREQTRTAREERAAAQDDLLEALRRSEAARADPQGASAGRAHLHRREISRMLELEAAGAEDALVPPVSTATAPPSVGAAKRPASRAQADAPHDASQRARRDAPVPKVEETPEEGIARVRALVGAGRIDAARDEVARLLCRYPDVKLPADLPAPDKTVPCRAVAPKEAMPDLR